MIVLACDPGVSPALAVYGGPQFAPVVFPPLGISRETKKKVDGKTKTVKRADPDEAAILSAFDTYRPDIFVIEQVGTRPDQGIASTGRFMESTGLVRGIALGKGCRVTRVLPNTWQRAFKMPKGDDISRQVCTRLFPFMADKFKLVKSHNECDALLMAVYIWCLETGTPLPVC